MQIIQDIQTTVARAIHALYGAEIEAVEVSVNLTAREFAGSYTVVLFPFVRVARKAPDVMGQEIGAYMKENMPTIVGFNVIKGFLNLELSAAYWHSFLQKALAEKQYGQLPPSGKRVMVEFASPNTNKPLHLGHIRNILLGWSSSRILEAAGSEVTRVQIVNDRGVAICKSMYAWQTYGEGRTPESEGIKSDHFVGDYYVFFDKENKREYAKWQLTLEAQALFKEKAKEGQNEAEFFKGYKNHWFNTASVMGSAVRDMLLKWEEDDPEIRALWKKMNQWVYDGFESTYAKLGVRFDKLYYESDTYMLGKEIVEEGLEQGLFYKKENGTIVIDLTDAGHDEKVMLRSDGTSVYITQDLGTARKRYQDFACDSVVYVVADEQNYHFQVLFEVLKRMKEPYAGGLYHLSYGLVELPSGRMKTREGTVVDADVLMDETIEVANQVAQENGVFQDLSAEEQAATIEKTGMGALKFFMLKVNPKKRMIFNPEESVAMQGQTGPYIQYNYVRTLNVIQKAKAAGIDFELAVAYTDLQESETDILVYLHEFPNVIQQAADEFDPSHLANYCYNLAKSYSRFWGDLSIFDAETEEAKAFRLQMTDLVGHVLGFGMDLLGIEMPNKM